MELEDLRASIKELKVKYNLIDFGFDTECIYYLGDLSELLKSIISQTIPDRNINVTEEISKNGEFYIATLTNSDTTMQIFTETDTDWISDDFIEKLYEIPATFGSAKKYYMINPAIGLTGQDTWYFCGTEKQLEDARKAGIPLIYPGEDPDEAPEIKKYR